MRRHDPLVQGRSVVVAAEVVPAEGKLGQRVRAVGAGHSFTDIGCTDEKNDADAAAKSYAEVTSAYAEHRSVIDQIVKLAELGVDAVLIGEALVRSAEPGPRLRQLVAAGALSTAERQPR